MVFSRERYELAIVNRSFWPVYPVVGEALLRFAEDLAPTEKVCVILQDHADIDTSLKTTGRGQGVTFFPCKALTSSASGVLLRVVDAIFFMLWVIFTLVRARPRKVYVSTDPPVLVPFVVMIYAKLFKASYVYHLQDIHPEAANVVFPVRPVLLKTLRWLDSITMRHADDLITITSEMAEVIRERSRTLAPLTLMENPAVSFEHVDVTKVKKQGFSFCGNAGRLQRIPLVISAIERYLKQGGQYEFAFAGGGVYADALKNLGERYPQVHYHGNVSATQAAQINADYLWALLPIEDEVTRYAFPSKSSSYVFSGACILAICGSETSVAQWVVSNKLGLCVEPNAEALAETFRKIEAQVIRVSDFTSDRGKIAETLAFDYFLKQLKRVIMKREHS